MNFCLGRMAKVVAQIRGVFQKTILTTPREGSKAHLHTRISAVFRLHTVTTSSGVTDYCYFFIDYHALTESYPLVPLPTAKTISRRPCGTTSSTSHGRSIIASCS